MSVLKKAEVYACPNGVYEDDWERAMAWHLRAFIQNDNGPEISFSAALVAVKNRRKIIEMLNELD